MNKATDSLTFSEQVNFLVTNRLPRRWLTLFIGRFSKIENPIVTKLSITVWRWFAEDLRLDEAKKSTFTSLHDCFTRELKEGARVIDKTPSVVTSPCDAIVGEFGEVIDGKLYQAKGFPYQINDLIPEVYISDKYKNGKFITLRLKSSMYHRFHSPIDCAVSQVTYISGDTWNVNPIALKKVERLFCKNERAVIDLHTGSEQHHLTLVPVAAILVASMKFHFIEPTLDMLYQGPNKIGCQQSFNKGDEMGYFQHGSTIILFASANYQFCEQLQKGGRVNVGNPLLQGHPVN
jgi:phosphatidylserine decarboxylase